MEHGEPAIKITDLEKTFINEMGEKVRVIRHLDLSVEQGQFISLLGPTGCGKTTMLRILSGLETATRGSVLISNAPPRAGRIPAGVVFQQNSLLPWKSVLKNVLFPLEIKNVPTQEAKTMAMELLDLVQLSKFAEAYPYELSGGMQQRTAIARALAQGTECLLMDEPFGALDDLTRTILQKALLGIWEKKGLTILFVTHNIEEALLLGSRVIVMGHGRIVHDEKVDLDRPRDILSPEFTSRFIALRARFSSAIHERD